MNISIISADAAQALNREVQKRIDPRLFLCCNYEPTVSYAVSEDGKYLIAIQDLYKFAIDSSCIIKNYRHFLPKKVINQFDRLQNILDKISLLRCIYDHSQSVQNGRIEQERLESYDIWLNKVLNKSTPETPADFALLNQTLSDMANELLLLLNQFIFCVSQNPNMQEVTTAWINRTLHWYCSNTKTEIYKGQLMDAYIANANANGKDYPRLYSSKSLNRKIRQWIENALYYPIDRELKEIDNKITLADNVLNGNGPWVQAIQAKTSAEKFTELKENFRQQRDENLQRRFSLLQSKQDLEQRLNGNPLDFFFTNLEQQLHNTMLKLDTEQISYTLLPQDLLQEDIHMFFGAVPSPDNDF